MEHANRAAADYPKRPVGSTREPMISDGIRPAVACES